MICGSRLLSSFSAAFSSCDSDTRQEAEKRKSEKRKLLVIVWGKRSKACLRAAPFNGDSINPHSKR
jgi:hypothetical protein